MTPGEWFKMTTCDVWWRLDATHFTITAEEVDGVTVYVVWDNFPDRKKAGPFDSLEAAQTAYILIAEG